MSKGEIVNKARVATITGKVVVTIDTWLRKGCPFVQKGGKGKEWLFDTAAVIAWREEQTANNILGDLDDLDFEELKKRKIAAETAMMELDLALKREDAVSLDDISKEWAAMAEAFRARCMAIGPKTAPLIAVEKNLNKCRKIIDDAVYEALNELSEYKSK